MNIDLEKDIVQSLSSLYPLQEFEEKAIDTVLDAIPHWIPVTERLPKEKDAGILKKLGTSKRSDYVLATVEVKGERMTVTACTYDGKWDWNMKYAFPDYKIIAWMPLPEPYKPTVPPECEGDCGWCKPTVIEKCKGVTE